jgi:hypothetical protein
MRRISAGSQQLPNCQWFGTKADHQQVLEQVFAMACFDVFEHYSRPDLPLRQFHSVDEVLSLFDTFYPKGPSASVANLMLWVRDSGPEPTIAKYRIQSGPLAGKWMERCEPMGCVTLSLEAGRETLLPYSNTNAVTETTLGAVGGKATDDKGIVWDVRRTNQVSSALNRKIRKMAAGKITSLAVLPGAVQRWMAGHDFGLSHGAGWSKEKTPDALVLRSLKSRLVM